MTFPALAAAVATLAASARKAGLKFSFREKFLLGSVKAYVDAPAPSHVVKFAGSITAAGASATQTLTVTGVAATDIVVVSVRTRAGAGSDGDDYDVGRGHSCESSPSEPAPARAWRT